MNLSRTDLQDIDDLARLDCDYDQKYYPHRRKEQAISDDTPGPLNSWRAFHMVWRLGLAAASLPDAEAALRENWPDRWRLNEQGRWFGDEWFAVLARYVLKEHELRRTQKSYRA
jgi:hypothetical protein